MQRRGLIIKGCIALGLRLWIFYGSWIGWCLPDIWMNCSYILGRKGGSLGRLGGEMPCFGQACSCIVTWSCLASLCALMGHAGDTTAACGSRYGLYEHPSPVFLASGTQNHGAGSLGRVYIVPNSGFLTS